MAGMSGLRSAFAVWLCVVGAAAGQETKPINLVQRKGPGRLIYRADPAWKISGLGLFDEGTRPVLEMSNKGQKMALSYLMFVNDTGKRDSESCRRAAMGPALAHLETIVTVKNRRQGTYTTKAGKVLMTASHLVANLGDLKMDQQNLFGFFGDASTCFEVHVSKYSFEPGDEKLLEAEMDRFEFEAGYQPTTMDYFQQGQILFRTQNAPAAAAFYYRAALDLMPPGVGDVRQVTLRRVLTDQLVMSYGMTGEFKKSRALANEAIARDPEYPLNYYNLACADAEQGHAADAKVHLQQAFDRKANTLPGETLPDPTHDDSFQKLKKDKGFWEFAQGFSTPSQLKTR